MKRARGTRRTNNDNRNSSLPDRISSLPDDVLCHILSFLPTKYSVRTRILSTRWKYLYALVPVLNFDSTSDDQSFARRERFAEFVTRVLMAYNVPLMTKFSLYCDFVFSDKVKHMLSWMSSVLCRNVQEIDIFVEFSVPLPYTLFSSKLLSVLKLEGNFSLKLLSSSFLPCLKSLQLISVCFDDSAGRIVSICPILEDLWLHACDFKNMKLLNISHSSLRELSIGECGGYELVLNAPSLINFVCVNSAPREICGEIVLESLDKSILRIDSKSSSYDVNIIVKLVTAVSHARILSLSKFVIEAFEGCSWQALPTFHKLAILEVGEVSKLVLGLLPDILSNCCPLEALLFTKGFCSEEFHDTDMICYRRMRSHVLEHLKELRFVNFRLLEIEWKLVEFFLRNAQVLEKMEIVTNLGWNINKSHECSKKLSTFDRFSRNCQIDIYSDDEDEETNDENEAPGDQEDSSDDETEDSDD